MNKNIFIPEKLVVNNINFKKINPNLTEEKINGLITEYFKGIKNNIGYFNEKNKKTIKTFRNPSYWSYGNIKDKIEENEFQNEWVEGIIVKEFIGGNSWNGYGWKKEEVYCLIEDPRGFEVKIKPENLFYLIGLAGTNKGKVINEKIKYGWKDDSLYILTSEDKTVSSLEKFSSLKKSGFIKFSDLIIGKKYLTVDNKDVVFLGKRTEFITVSEENKKYSTPYRTVLMLCEDTGRIYASSLDEDKTILSLLSDEIPVNLTEMLDNINDNELYNQKYPEKIFEIQNGFIVGGVYKVDSETIKYGLAASEGIFHGKMTIYSLERDESIFPFTKKDKSEYIFTSEEGIVLDCKFLFSNDVVVKQKPFVNPNRYYLHYYPVDQTKSNLVKITDYTNITKKELNSLNMIFVDKSKKIYWLGGYYTSYGCSRTFEKYGITLDHPEEKRLNIEFSTDEELINILNKYDVYEVSIYYEDGRKVSSDRFPNIYRFKNTHIKQIEKLIF